MFFIFHTSFFFFTILNLFFIQEIRRKYISYAVDIAAYYLNTFNIHLPLLYLHIEESGSFTDTLNGGMPITKHDYFGNSNIINNKADLVVSFGDAVTNLVQL